MSGLFRRGSSLVEFVFAGVPILLVIISVMEIARCMWTYNTLSYAVTQAARMAVVQGETCATPPNVCPVTTVSGIAQRIADSSQGLLTDQMSLTLTSTGTGGTVNCALPFCLTNASPWPVAAGYTPGTATVVTVKAVYPFQSPMTIFFPGFSSPTSWITANLPASAQEQFQF